MVDGKQYETRCHTRDVRKVLFKIMHIQIFILLVTVVISGRNGNIFRITLEVILSNFFYKNTYRELLQNSKRVCDPYRKNQVLSELTTNRLHVYMVRFAIVQDSLVTL